MLAHARARHSDPTVPVARNLEASDELAQIKQRVHAFSSSFAMPGFDVSGLEPSEDKTAHGTPTEHVISSNGHHAANGNSVSLPPPIAQTG